MSGGRGLTNGLEALIFDFDGVLLESEFAGNRHIAEYLSGKGYKISPEEAMARFSGLSGEAFVTALEQWIGGSLPDDYHLVRDEENVRVLQEGIEAVAGAVDFVERLPPELPRAIASSSSTSWVERHLAHLGLSRHFQGRIFSGREHVSRGKPAPDLYLYAAAALGVDITKTCIIEDSPVGVTGAVASGALVIGLCAGSHCPADHGERLKALGVHHVAASFDEVAALIF